MPGASGSRRGAIRVGAGLADVLDWALAATAPDDRGGGYIRLDGIIDRAEATAS